MNKINILGGIVAGIIVGGAAWSIAVWKMDTAKEVKYEPNNLKINSISKTSGAIGDVIEVRGNLLDRRGDQNLRIMNSKEEDAQLTTDITRANGEVVMTFTLADKECKEFGSDRGGPCMSDSMQITPGEYSIYVKSILENSESNKVKFTVTANTSIKPSITVIYPNGKETLKIGQAYKITFNSVGDLGTKTIRLNSYSDDGIRLNSYYVGSTQDASEFTYTIPATVEPTRFGPNYRIQVLVDKYNTGMGVADESDNYFTITRPMESKPSIEIASPRDGATFTKNSPKIPFTWSSNYKTKKPYVYLWPNQETPNYTTSRDLVSGSEGQSDTLNITGTLSTGQYRLFICDKSVTHIQTDILAELCAQSGLITITN